VSAVPPPSAYHRPCSKPAARSPCPGSAVSAALEVLVPAYARSRGQHSLRRRQPVRKLPVTFPKTDADLPHPQIPGIDLIPPAGAADAAGCPIRYRLHRGPEVGYKWFDAKTSSRYSPSAMASATPASRTQAQGGHDSARSRCGTRQARPALRLSSLRRLPAAANEPPKRLVAWTKSRWLPAHRRPSPCRRSEVPVDLR